MSTKNRWCLVLGVSLLAITASAQPRQRPPASEMPSEEAFVSTAEQAESAPIPSPNAVVAVENVDDLNILRRFALVVQYMLTPTSLAQQVAPLHAYTTDSLCDAGIAEVQERAGRYGPAAIVRQRAGGWEADYYSNVREVVSALQIDQDMCTPQSDSNNGRLYVGTTYPIRNQEPDVQLLLMDAARILPGWSHEVDPGQR